MINHTSVFSEIYFWLLVTSHDTLAFPGYVSGGQVVIKANTFIP